MKVSLRKISTKNGQKIVLRSPLASEAEHILNHLRITHAESYKNLNQSFDYWNEFRVEDEAKILTEFENAKNKFMLCAFYNDRIVGALGFVGFQAEFVRKTGSLGMSIQNEFSNSGLGTQMLQYTLELAKEIGFHRVELTVRTYNQPGIKLYENLGFQKIGLLSDAAFIDGDFVDEYSFQIILNGK
jgi:RimJ/RimL family protein N-acetyltransferase